MNRLFLTLMAVCTSTAGFAAFHQQARISGAAGARIVQQFQADTNALVTTQQAVTSLREEVRAKRLRLRQANRHLNLSPELLALLEEDQAGDHARAWAEIRRQLDLGWNASPDYVLVRKQVIPALWYNKLDAGGHLTRDAIELLSLSPEEQTAVNIALAHAREGPWFNVQSAPPSGDIVAQYTITPPDPSFEAGQSNDFAAAIGATLGTERAHLFLPDAWRNFTGNLAPTTAQTMTIRQTTVDGQPDLLCEVTQNGKMQSDPVRFAHYPAFPILKLFPGGWQAMAAADGFTLPPAFMPASDSQ